MAKFVLECPNCGKYVEARTGFFARKKIDCSCGHNIDVQIDKMTNRVCPHCGNNVVFDQSKGKKTECPVCGEKINAMVAPDRMEDFTCAQCGVHLSCNTSAKTFSCPVCDYENDVAERIMSEKIKKDSLASTIKYEGDNETFVWKHPVEDFNLGSQLIVHESQEAIFSRDGQALDLFGAGRYTLETQQLPILEKLYKLPTDTEATFHSEVYFTNTSTQMGIKWGTDSKVRLFDPTSGLHIEIGASGEFNIKIINSRKLLLKLVGTNDKLLQDELLGTKDAKGMFRAMVMTQVKSYLAQTIKENSINILEIDAQLMMLSEALRERINTGLVDYGLEITEFFVSSILTPDDDPNFRRMKQQYAEQYLLVRQEQIRKLEAEAARERMTVEAQTAAQMKIIAAQGEGESLKIQKAAEAEAYKMQAEAEAAEMRMKGFNYQMETSRLVGLEAMQNGLISENGASGGIGDIAGLGVTLGAMGGVINMTKDAMEPIFHTSTQTGKDFAGILTEQWDCVCGQKGVQGKFCSNCGSQKPQPKMADTWDCTCGSKGLTGRFCPECGTKKPEMLATWDCVCGSKGLSGKFCPECGMKKPETLAVWDCTCGNKGITGNFCDNCGTRKGE